jgi:N-acyl-D-aspartate/D-glutamate deacylase
MPASPGLLLFISTFLIIACDDNSENPHYEYDLLVKNAVVADGSGGSLFEADILIDGGVIAGVSEPGTADEGAAQVVDDPDRVEMPRGLIREGFAADVLLFDPDNVVDKATFEDPHQYAEGFDWVFVNGVAVIEEGKRNQLTPSGVIRRSQQTVR